MTDGERLQTLISDLMTSQSDGDRARTRDHFEQRFRIADEKLTRMIKLNKTDAMSVMKFTSNAIQSVARCKERCKTLKNRILECKNMLQSNKNDIRHLWIESLEHKFAYQMLQRIQNLKEVPSIVSQLLNKKECVRVSETLATAICVIETDLNGIEGLKDLKAELYMLRDATYEIYREELRQELFMSSFHFVFQGNSKDAYLEDISYDKVFKNRALKDRSVSFAFNQEKVKHYLESLSLLGKTKNALLFLVDNFHTEPRNITRKLSKLMCDVIERSTESPILECEEIQQRQYLIELLETIIGHFRQLIINSKLFCNILECVVVNENKSQKNGFEMEDVYSSIQAAIQDFMTDYLESKSLTSLFYERISVFPSNQNFRNMSIFIKPEDSAEKKCPQLFKFNSVTQTRNVNPFHDHQQIPDIREHGQTETQLRRVYLVCNPAVRNISFVFGILKCFALEMEEHLNSGPPNCCPLRAFLFDSCDQFLDDLNSEIHQALEKIYLNLETWTVSAAMEISTIGPEKRILSAVLILNRNVKYLHELVGLMPDYSLHFLNLVHYIVQNFKDMANEVFKTLFVEDHAVLSVNWAKDRDIRRLLKSFNNWKYLLNVEHGEMMESPEEIRLRHKEESDMLLRNVQSEERDSWDIINNYDVLSNIALMQESLHWFAEQLRTFIEEIKNVSLERLQDSRAGEIENVIESLQKLTKVCEDYADMCLVTLHLEVRCHCFQYLLPFSVKGKFSVLEFQSVIRSLTQDFVKIEEVLLPVLTNKEFMYVFEGLGEIVAALVILIVSLVNKTDEHLEKCLYESVFYIQCCLGSITLTRETSLERARQYILLISQSCEDILTDIVEEGPKFRKHEYASIFTLVSKSENDKKNLEEHLGKLETIFKRISTNM